MGRQKGQSQRTKGNIRPSSSGRAASLLSDQQRFVGFNAMAGDLGYVPILKSIDDKDAVIDPDFRVVLSKLSKKDVTTKLKALTEFVVLCSNRGVDEAANILPYWPRIYNRLSDDGDRRVRENAQIALNALVNLLGKKIAPYLKQMMGSWWIAQCDSYAPAASGAKKAFKIAFPSAEKQRKALLFCCEEILQALSTNIFMTLNVSQSSLSEEDVKMDKERIISTSFAALASFLHTLAVEDIKQIPVASLETFYLNQKLWKFAKHKAPTVRAAFYNLVASFCSCIPDLVVSQLPTMCKCILHKLDESNPIVGRSIWGATEQLTSSFCDWSEHIDIRKGFLPQLWSMLKSGFHGNAKIICSHLLPLISQFPSSISILPVYEELFKCLRQGLNSETALKSSMETKAIITATIECMQLVLQRSIETSDVVDEEVIHLVVKGQLLPILRESLTNEGFQSFLTLPLHQLFAQLMYDLAQKSSIDSMTQSSYLNVCSMIWEELVIVGNHIISGAIGEDIERTTFNIFLNFLVAVESTTRTNMSSEETQTEAKHVRFADAQMDDPTQTSTTKISHLKNCLLYQQLQTAISHIIKHVLQEKLDDIQKVFVISLILENFSDYSLFQLLSRISTSADDVEAADDVNATDGVKDGVTLKQESPAFLFLQHVMQTIQKAFANEPTERGQKSAAILFNSCVQHCGDEVVCLLKTLYADPVSYGGKRMCIMLSQSFVKDEQQFLQRNNGWFVEFVLNLIKELSSSEMKSSEAWTFLLMLMTGNFCKPLLEPELALHILEILQYHLLECSTTAQVAIEVNKITFSCFNTYVDKPEVVDKGGEILTSGLLSLLNIASEDPSEYVLSSIKHNIGSLLRTCYNCESLLVREIAERLCKKVADVMTNKLFVDECGINCIAAFVQIITITAEELVMHHMRQDYIADWLDCISPSESQMQLLRPPLKSQRWISTQRTNLTGLVNSRYIDIMQAYTEVSVELSTFFSEVYHYLAHSSRLQSLFVEILLAKAVAAKFFDITIDQHGYTDEFIRCVLSSLVQNSVEFGGGWLLCFEQFSQWATSSQWDESFVLNSVSLEELCPSEALVGTLIVFVKKCFELSKVQFVLAWALQKALDVQICSSDSDENNSSAFAMSIKLTVFSLKRINELKNANNEDNNICSHQAIVEKILEWKSSHPQSFLFDCDLSVATEHLLKLNVAVIEFLECIVNIYPCTLSTEVWDFVECSLVSWTESCCATFTRPDKDYASLQASMLNGTCSLMKALEKFITSSEALNDPTLPVSLTTEWGEFFKPSAQASLVSIFVNLTENGEPQVVELQELVGDCLESISTDNLLSCSSRFETHLLPNSGLSDSIQTLLHHLGLLLLPSKSNDCSLRQVISYSLLAKLAQRIFNEETPSAKPFLPPEQLLHILDLVTPRVNEAFSILTEQSNRMGTKAKRITILEDHDEELSDESTAEEGDFEDTFDAIPNIASIQSFLLVWKLLVGLIHHIPTEARSKYTVSLNERQVTCISKLLPVLVLLLPKKPYTTSVDMNTTGKCSMFTSEIKFSASVPQSLVVQHLACLLYKDILLTLPALTRSWFNSLTKLERSNTDDYACKYVSPALCKEELDAVSQFKTPPGLEVRARRQTREVVATYEVSEADFEILIELPPNYPLTPAHVNTIRKAGVSSSLWRYWILQMTMLLQHQNGNILDALLLWKQKVDKRLDGLEECMICFSIVYGTNAQSLPKLQCKTCKKKYHAECLYKWFDTSSQSTCPLCRSPMMFK